jgi:acetyltransferase-like isoleucine patch superfamily enzyme
MFYSLFGLKKKIKFILAVLKFTLRERALGYTYKQFYDYYYLILNGVDTKLGYVTLLGKPVIQKHPNSIIRIEKGVTLVSDVTTNIAGISHPVILATLRKNSCIHIGKDSGLSGSTICCAASVQLGEYVGIGVNTSIYDTDFHALDPYERKFDNDNNTISKPIVIADFVWIGGHSIILKGVNIANGAIIGAGSVISKDIPELSIYAGNPAKFIKKINVDDTTYDNLFNASS